MSPLKKENTKKKQITVTISKNGKLKKNMSENHNQII